MKDDFSEIERLLHDRGMFTYRQQERQLIVSRQRGPAWPDRGNSFWVSKLGADWYVCTWPPYYYRVPSQSSVVDVSEAFVDVGTKVQGRIPPELIARFELVEVDDEDFDRRWEEAARPVRQRANALDGSASRRMIVSELESPLARRVTRQRLSFVMQTAAVRS